MPTRNISATSEQVELKLELLCAQLALGVSALDSGNATEIADGEIESYLAELGAPRSRRSRRKRAR